ncbi:MAG: antitoxin, RHH family protein [Elusimicrobia bacterium]|nr:antitoxin, RHH family protein [Candidatus Obscuribacterium magneticum]
MPARNPRINVVLEEPIYKAIANLARHDRVSLSLKVRDLIREALEIHEDRVLSRIAEGREKTFERSHALSHDAVWGSLKYKKAA